MAPLAGDAVGPGYDRSVDHEAAAAPGADDDAKDNPVSASRAVHGLGQHKAIGVVGKPDRAADRLRQVAVQRATNEAGRICVPDESRRSRHRSRNGDSDGGGGAEPGIGLGHQLGQGPDGPVVIACWCWNPSPKALAAARVEDGALDLRAAQIEPNSQVPDADWRRYAHPWTVPSLERPLPQCNTSLTAVWLG